jgi:hypothetical protein
MFNVAEFWPSPLANQAWNFVYDGPIVLRSVFFKDTAGTLYCVDYQDGAWKDTWLMRKDPVRGVLEYGDDIETTNWWEKRVIGPIKKIRYKPGKEIVWGHHQNVGDIVHAQVEIDHRASTMLPPFTTKDSFGYQTVGFDSLVDDMLVMTYVQPWGSKVYGAKYHMKHGVGPIKIEWRKPDGTFTDPVVATVTI